MIPSMKFVFVAVAVICYMQTANTARIPRDTNEAPALPALPANLLESLAKPEFWQSLTQNITSNFNEDNLKKLGINADEVKNTLNSAASELQKNLAELTKNLSEQKPAASKTSE